MRGWYCFAAVRPPARYSAVAVFLHWGVAAAIVGQLSLGWWMQEIPKGVDGSRAWWFNLHKSMGLLLAAFILVRLAWRVTNGAPPLPASIGPWQQKAAAVSHAGLYGCMVALPLSGYLGSSFSGYPVKVFGWTLPAWGWAWPAAKNLMSAVHATAVWLLVGLICLHLAAAFLHALRGDGVLRRMWI
jgi:cytochrome b561